MKRFTLVIVSLSLASCGAAWGKKPTRTPTPAQPCVVQRIDGGVKITCPTSEEILYDGEDGVNGTDGVAGVAGQDGQDGQDGAAGADGRDGRDGTSCSIDGNGLVTCGTETYQLPTATETDGCQVFVLPKS